jgi:twitching motility two-component system response regulator PilG
MNYQVALCGLTARDERLIEIVITRAPNPKYRYLVGSMATLGEAHIAVADVASAQAETHLAELRALNPALVTVYLSDLGLSGASRYRIERRSLLLHINRVLDKIVECELQDAHLRQAAAPTSTGSNGTAERPEIAFVNAAEALAHAPPPPLRALIVDDSLTVREQLRAALDRAGILSDQAAGADAAFEELRNNSYDIIFLDVVMPGADGYEVCRGIKKNAYTRSIPVLMLTSRSSPFDRARGALAGCDSYLVKPITWETFFAAVDKVLAKQFRNDRALLNARGYRTALAS